MFRFIELDHLSEIDGWSTETLLVLLQPIVISFLGTLVFGALGALALRKQIQRIGSEGAESVSVEWNLVFLAMWSSLVRYGFERDSLALVIQCTLRAPFYVVIVRQLYRYHGDFSRRQWGLAGLMVLATALSFIRPTLIATILLWVSIFFAAHQPWEIWRTRSTKGVELRVLLVYLMSALFWMFYGFGLKDYYIVSWAIGYAIVYVTGITVHRIYHIKTT